MSKDAYIDGCFGSGPEEGIVTVTETPGPAPSDLPVRTIRDMTPEEQSEILNPVFTYLVNGYASQDYVRHIMVHPNDVEFIQGWIKSITDMPEIVSQFATVHSNSGAGIKPSVIVHSQIETEWLTQHYKDMGLMEFIKKNGAPIILTHRDLKLLFLVQGLLETSAPKSRIILP